MTIAGDLTPGTVDGFLSEAAEHLGRWDEACLLLESGGDRREALMSISSLLQRLERAIRGAGRIELADVLDRAFEYIRLVMTCVSIPTENVAFVLKAIYGALLRWVVGLRADALHYEDVSELNEFILQQRNFLKNEFDLNAKKWNLDSISYSIESPVLLGKSENAKLCNADVGSSVGCTPGSWVDKHDASLNRLIDLIGQISAQQDALEVAASQPDANCSQLKRMIALSRVMLSELCASAVGLRLIPVQSVFEKLNLHVKDFARRRELALQLELTGHDTLIDKDIGNTLLNALANLIEVVVESSSDKHKGLLFNGKNGPISLRIHASPQSTVVSIVIEADSFRNVMLDNRGGEKESFRFLDAAMESLREIGANICFHSRVWPSKRLEIVIPASPRWLEVVLVRCNESTYAVPVHDIEEIIEPGGFSTHVLRTDTQMIESGGKLFPFATLVQLFETQPSLEPRRVRAAVAIEQGFMLLLRMGSDFVAVGVETVIQTTKMLVTPPQPHLRGVKGLIGTIASGAGDPIVVIDLPGIAFVTFGSRHERRAA